MQEYDEDLSRNPFLKFLREQYSFLYEEAIRKHWLLCIPSATSLVSLDCQFDEHYVRQHLILQDGDVSRTLADDPVRIHEDCIDLGPSKVKILFKETFYTKTGKVSAVCVLHSDSESDESFKSPILTLSTKRHIRQCVAFVRSLLMVNVGDYKGQLDEIKSYLSQQSAKISDCVVYNLYSQLMETVTLLVRKDDQQLNKARRNHCEAKSKDLIHFEKSLQVLDSLANRKLDKVESLRQLVTVLGETGEPLDADRLLSIFSYLIQQSSVTNWAAQLKFIQLFSSYRSSAYGHDAYLISTLEAALDHVKSLEPTPVHPDIIPSDDAKDLLYHSARTGDSNTLIELVSGAQFTHDPLCSCGSCGQPLVVDPTACDANGLTALHYSCIYAQTDCVQILLKTAFLNNVGAKEPVNGRTALHLAAFNGFQTGLLLLCHIPQCDLNARDREGNTALHLAALNGHESCVKALLYYSETAHFMLDLNAKNRLGRTALHLASQWGYQAIVNLLLQWDADTRLADKNCQTADMMAQNVEIARLISRFNEATEAHSSSASIRLWTGIKRQLSIKK